MHEQSKPAHVVVKVQVDGGVREDHFPDCHQIMVQENLVLMLCHGEGHQQHIYAPGRWLEFYTKREGRQDA